MFGENTRPGSKEWYRGLISLTKSNNGPVYLLGAETLSVAAERGFQKHNLGVRTDLVMHVIDLDGVTRWEDVLPKTARRDARIGDRKGLILESVSGGEGLERFYSIYKAHSKRLGVPQRATIRERGVREES